MPKRTSRPKTKKVVRHHLVNWALILSFAAGALLSPVAYFGATTLAATGTPDFRIAQKKPDCPFAGWNSASCSVDSFTMKKGKHYTFSGLGEVSATSNQADIGYAALSSGNFFNRYGTDAMPMAYSTTPQDDYSFASIWYGGTGDIKSVTCPTFQELKLSDSKAPTFSYLDGTRKADGSVDWNSASLTNFATGDVYCVVNHDDSVMVKMKVLTLSSTSITVQLLYVGKTGLKTYGCADGYCNADVHDYCVGCSATDVKLLNADLTLRTTVKQCVDAKLKPAIARPTVRQIFPDSLGAPSGEGTTYAEGSGSRAYGYEGIYKPGETKVTTTGNIRISQHEMIHQYNHAFVLDTTMRSFIDEGFAIAIARQLGTSCSPNAFDDAWRQVTYASVKSGKTDPAGLDSHALGSLFFEGLATDYGCSGTCVYSVWQSMQDYYQHYLGADGKMTNYGIYRSIKNVTNQDVHPLLDLLKITDSTP